MSVSTCKRKRCGRWLGLSAIGLAMVAAGRMAEAAPPAPAPTNVLVLPATGGVISLPAPETVQPITLSRAQAAQLAAMLGTALQQGIMRSTAATALTSDASDAALVAATLAYARAVHAGQIASGEFPREWGLRPAAYDPTPSFREAVTRDTLARWIASLPPPYAGYDGLRQGLARYRAIEAAGGWTPLGGGEDLRLGAKGRRVAELRRRLRIEDPDVPGSGDTFDIPLLEGVRRAQRRYGLEPTGNVAALTRAALNVPVERRIDQIVANLERWRWLPQDLPRDRVQVNIAAAVLTVFSGDAPVMSMRAVTGRPEDKTPMLQSQVHSVVLNPPWNVPTSIATRELLPKERASPGYLKRNGFKVIPLDGGGSRLQQAAGNQSALGRYKFDFDNPYSVYLHDTPSRGTFDRYSRLASHGCVRLEKPGELAELLLKDDPRWSPDAIQATVAKSDTVRARLPQPVAVYLLYWTAFPAANGQIAFRDDPYGWDGALVGMVRGPAGAEQMKLR